MDSLGIKSEPRLDHHSATLGLVAVNVLIGLHDGTEWPKSGQRIHH
jgi:hypothetical protein